MNHKLPHLNNHHEAWPHLIRQRMYPDFSAKLNLMFRVHVTQFQELEHGAPIIPEFPNLRANHRNAFRY
jgi:hypothetical protein